MLYSQADIAKKYGGNYYFDSDNVNSNSLNEAFSKNPCTDGDDEEKGIPLMSSAGSIGDRKFCFCLVVVVVVVTFFYDL